MKKLLLLGPLLIWGISCTKENYDKKEKLTLESTSEIENAFFITNLDSTYRTYYGILSKSQIDSINRMNAGEFLESNLTKQEIDSIAKINSGLNNYSRQVLNYESEEYDDWSHYIHLKIFSQTTTQESNLQELTVEVSPDYVVVGGGAWAHDYSNDGGFITQSRPNSTLTSWIGRSKAHIHEDLHNLTVYAIGMRIDGVTPTYLRSKIHLVSSTSPIANHPYTSVQVPYNCLLIGGGAWDDYQSYGNMLVASYPMGRRGYWYASGKDHRRPDPCRITAYAIGIENISFPTVGSIQVDYVQVSEAVPIGDNEHFVATSSLPNWALTCVGGQTTYIFGNGRMLVGIYPFSTDDVQEISRYHTYPDLGTDYVYALMIQKKIN